VVLSKRERYIGIITVAVLAILVLDHFIVSPLLDQKAELDAKINDAQGQLDRADRLFSTARRASRKWSEMARGAIVSDSAEADRILNRVSEWANESGMSLPSLKPERDEKEAGFNKKTFRATGAGTMAQIGRFLYKIQTANIPVRITDLTISSHKEGTDDLSITFGVATIYQLPPADNNRNAANQTAAAMVREELP
jgi:Tfp pilus assembly protein PilO